LLDSKSESTKSTAASREHSPHGVILPASAKPLIRDKKGSKID
jgi:hypothetical protein